MLQIHGESLKVLKFGMFTKCLPMADQKKKKPVNLSLVRPVLMELCPLLTE